MKGFPQPNSYLYHLSCRYQYEWKIEEAKKNILRTHTTAVSARMLYKLAQQVIVTLLISIIIYQP